MSVVPLGTSPRLLDMAFRQVLTDRRDAIILRLLGAYNTIPIDRDRLIGMLGELNAIDALQKEIQVRVRAEDRELEKERKDGTTTAAAQDAD